MAIGTRGLNCAVLLLEGQLQADPTIACSSWQLNSGHAVACRPVGGANPSRGDSLNFCSIAL
jgi:hypothetical protein